MRYLLVGNAPNPDLAAAQDADVIVQVNDCPHAAALPLGRTRYVVIVNTGPTVSPAVVERLCSRRALLPNACIVLARNPTYYTVKKWVVRVRGRYRWYDYQVSNAWHRLRGLWPVQTLSCASAFRLDLQMIARGMPKSWQPSTGMIAYDWLRRRLRTGDSLAVEGFTFQGCMDLHSWQTESQIVRPVLRKLPWDYPFESDPTDFLRLRAFFAWFCIFSVLGVLAVWHGMKTLCSRAMQRRA